MLKNVSARDRGRSNHPVTSNWGESPPPDGMARFRWPARLIELPLFLELQLRLPTAASRRRLPLRHSSTSCITTKNAGTNHGKAGRRKHAPEHGDADGPACARAGAGGEHQRHDAGYESERRHQDRTHAGTCHRASDDRLTPGPPLAATSTSRMAFFADRAINETSPI
jgi:hypothetical protein